MEVKYCTEQKSVDVKGNFFLGYYCQYLCSTLTLLLFPALIFPFLLLMDTGPGSMAPAPPVICDPAPPLLFLLSLPTLGGGAKFPTGGIFISGLGVWAWLCGIPVR